MRYTKEKRSSLHRYYIHRERKSGEINRVLSNENRRYSLLEKYNFVNTISSSNEDLNSPSNALSSNDTEERLKNMLINIILLLAVFGTLVNFQSKFQELSIVSSEAYSSRTLKSAAQSSPEYNTIENVENEFPTRDNLEYFNLNEDGTKAPILSKYKKGGPVITALVPNNEKDIDELKYALKSLKFFEKDNKEYPAPVLIFNEGDLSNEVQQSLADCTTRPVGFPLVDFTEFPENFNPDDEKTEFYVGGRRTWGYYQMIRFWVTGIWMHSALEPYEIVVRIDSDSCFMEPNPDLPYLPTPQAVYYSQYVGFESDSKFVQGLWDKVNEWVEAKGITIANPMFWHFAEQTWNLKQTLPVFRTNFEASRKSFMMRSDVIEFHEMLTEKQPFGVFRHRWGDAVTRFLLVSIFSESDKVVISRAPGYGHKELCEPEQYALRYGLDVDKLKASIPDNADYKKKSLNSIDNEEKQDQIDTSETNLEVATNEEIYGVEKTVEESIGKEPDKLEAISMALDKELLLDI